MKKKIYVVGYESKNKLATSGWEWFFDKSKATTRYNDLKNDLEQYGAIVYRGEVIVENVTDDEIPEFIEIFLEENGWEKSFI